MTTFISTNCCEKLETKCLNGNLYNKEDKEVLVHKLNTRISQLEQEDKDFEKLIEEFKQLENDVGLLREAKLRLEYEMKQRGESYNKRINDLKSDNENLQNALKDKLCVNKKLFEEKQCLESQLKSKKDEITDLTNNINNINNRFNNAESDKDNLNNLLNELNAVKATQKDKIAELFNDNKKLAQLCQERDNSLYLSGQEKAKLNKKLFNDNQVINNLNSKLRVYSTNLNNLQDKVDKSNILNSKLSKDLLNLEDAYKKFELDNQKMRDEWNKQHFILENEDKSNNQMRIILNDRKNKLRCLSGDYCYLKNIHDNKCEENNMYQIENEKLKDHMMILTKQNDNLSYEIDNIIKEDNQMKDILNRSNRMSTMLKSNDSIIHKMPSNIYTSCEYELNKTQMSPVMKRNRVDLSQNFERRRCFSPKLKYTYSRFENN